MEDQIEQELIKRTLLLVDQIAEAVAAHAALLSTHGVTGSIVGTSDIQTLSNKTIDDPLITNDLVFTTSGKGLLFGGMYLDDGTTAIVVTMAGVYYPITSGISSSLLNGFTFSSASQLVCEVAGTYLVNWALTLKNSNSDRTVAGVVMVNTTDIHSTENATKAKENGVDYSVGGTGLITLAVGDIVRVAVTEYTGTSTITVTHVNMTLVMVGG